MYEKYSIIPAVAALATLAVQLFIFLVSYNNIAHLYVFPLRYRGSVIQDCDKILDSVLNANFTVFGSLSFVLLAIGIISIVYSWKYSKSSLMFVAVFNTIAMIPFGVLNDTSAYLVGFSNLDLACKSVVRSSLSLLNMPILSICLYILLGNLLFLTKKDKK